MKLTADDITFDHSPRELAYEVRAAGYHVGTMHVITGLSDTTYTLCFRDKLGGLFDATEHGCNGISDALEHARIRIANYLNNRDWSALRVKGEAPEEREVKDVFLLAEDITFLPISEASEFVHAVYANRHRVGTMHTIPGAFGESFTLRFRDHFEGGFELMAPCCASTDEALDRTRIRVANHLGRINWSAMRAEDEPPEVPTLAEQIEEVRAAIKALASDLTSMKASNPDAASDLQSAQLRMLEKLGSMLTPPVEPKPKPEPDPSEFNDGAEFLHYEDDPDDVIRIRLTQSAEHGAVVGGVFALGRDVRHVAHANGMIQMQTTSGEFTFYVGDEALLIYTDICRRMHDGSKLR